MELCGENCEQPLDLSFRGEADRNTTILPDETKNKRKRSRKEVESKNVKRGKTLLFSKAGFEVPNTDQPFEKNDGDKNDHVQSMIIQKQVEKTISISLDSFQGLVCSARLGMNGGSTATSPSKEIISSKHDTPIRQDLNVLPISGMNDDSESTKSTDKVKEIPKVNYNRESALSDFRAPRSLVAPTRVHVSRPAEVADSRMDLPVVMKEQEIMESINEYSTVIIKGETGTGKTTQVPQFLFEAGYGSSLSCDHSGIIGITQPRRVAVYATAERVAYELGLHLGKEVGFQVRHDRRMSKSCSIKFMTDGILLQELKSDLWLRKYSVIILDEVHVRSLNTDLLLGMLSQVIEFRKIEYEKQIDLLRSGENLRREELIFPLKLVLMSATLRVKDFVGGLFDEPPIIEVPTRQFSVTVFHEKRTDEEGDYVEQAYNKVLKIHMTLPRGGILVFVTGRREVEHLCGRLQEFSRKLVMKKSFEVHGNAADHPADRFGDDGDSLFQDTPGIIDVSVAHVLGENDSIVSQEGNFDGLAGKSSLCSNSAGKHPISVTLDACSNRSNRSVGKRGSGVGQGSCPGAMHVVPLYAMLPAGAQLAELKETNKGERLVVVATNVAETSLTIHGIKYVVDTGREKVKDYNPSNGMETYKIQWISKASANQRKGRAGRTGDGYCYRLYSQAAFHKFSEFSLPEISKVPVDGVVLHLKSMNIREVTKFPFPTPPAADALNEAERLLMALEASDRDGRLTPLGHAMAHYPLCSRHSRMLLLIMQIMSTAKDQAQANLVLAYGVAAVAVLSCLNPFIRKFEDSHTKYNDNAATGDVAYECLNQEKLKRKKQKETLKKTHERFFNPSSDALSIAYALQCYELSKRQVKFCNENALHPKTMEEMSKLRKQILKLVLEQSGVSGGKKEFSWIHGSMEDVEKVWRVCHDKNPLSLYEEGLICQAICAGWADRVAKRIRGSSSSGSSELGDRKVRRVQYQACMIKETVLLDRWSSVSNSAPEFLVYNELVQAKSGPYMYGITCVKSEWLVKYARALCTFSAPPTDTKPYYEPLTDQVFGYAIPAFGCHLWELPLSALPIDRLEDRVKAFAYSLLQGQVVPCLKHVHVRKYMAEPPATVLKREAAGRLRVGNLLGKLKEKRIDSCGMLRRVWNEDPKILYPEIMAWFQESFRRSRFEALWFVMRREVGLE